MKGGGWGRRALLLHSGFVYFFLYAPIAIIVIFSFSASRSPTAWSGFTLDWYRSFFHNAGMLQALQNSLVVGLCATALSTVIGTLVAFGLDRFDFPGRRFLDQILYLPIVIPDIVMALSLALFYHFIHLPLGLFSIIIGHVAFDISFVAVVVRARLEGFDRRLEEAAQDLGADGTQTFLRVTLPLLMPGVVAAALLAFTLSFEDFMIAFFTAGVGSTTLPIKVYSSIKFGVTPEINAISTCILAFAVFSILAAQRLMGKEQVQSAK
ncbi:MAG: ABC transporter permease [Candidatus Latescibacteria bacterium]|nr:ABC transporter permease [Candidatus Latescibacterota bacterium]